MGYRINIAGVVGVGKSSLTNLIWDKWKFVPFREPVFDNPLLDKFYYDKKRYAFPLQVFFLNKRFEMCKKSFEYGSSVMDRSIIEDTIFAKMLRDSGDMDPYEYQIYRELFTNMMEHVVPPDLMVYLKVQPEESVRRIRKRGREYEVKNDTDYWYTLSQNYNEFFYDYNWSKLLTIDCDDLDFVNNQNDQDYILDQIDGALG
jgi:deoxyadenosine/deoxycytidine kinase